MFIPLFLVHSKILKEHQIRVFVEFVRNLSYCLHVVGFKRKMYCTNTVIDNNSSKYFSFHLYFER